MAKHVLSIPVSTIASVSAFSVGGRVIEMYRSKLLPSNAEALICLRDWMFDIDFRAESVDDADDVAMTLGNLLSIKETGNDVVFTVGSSRRSWITGLDGGA
ncbi:hypothetical protein NE237_007003 [Protea cynaroides]|uniref:HAT C-terminal dimerisation domain-containing protein n=1 Tax=Protea cynaroides TaxID=273540 RepID=A0A9Q0QW20_9MAGN|nr:hypothetical protein NE237_007003 [Protea cynaroides]